MDQLIELHTCASEKSTMSFPLGALCIKTAINQSISIPKAVVFEHVLLDDPVTAADECSKRNPYAVGLSVYIWNKDWLFSFASKLRELSKDVIIFAGGPQMSLAQSSYPEILNFVVIGEGEINTVKALENKMNGIILPELPNLDLLESPFLSEQAESQLSGTDSVLWELTRGCPFSCSFCFESRGKKTVRDYPFDRIEKELQYLINHEIRNVFVLDPTFNLNIDRAKKILRLLIERAPSYMHFTFEVRAEFIDEELADLFSRCNCSLQIGLQSADETVLNAIGRKFDKAQFSNNVGLLAKKGVAFGLDLIIGLPEDTLSGFRKTVNYAISLCPSNLDIFVLSLLPGTELASKHEELQLQIRGNGDFTLLSSPTFCEEDIRLAVSLKDAIDLFYTKGQACMWIHCLLETLNITACNLFSLFIQWMRQTERSAEEDIWILQDDFVQSLLQKTQNNKLIPAMKSFMELHQGLCYVTDTCEDAILDLSYCPDELASLDHMGLAEFVKTYKQKNYKICLSFDDEEGVVWKYLN